MGSIIIPIREAYKVSKVVKSKKAQPQKSSKQTPTDKPSVLLQYLKDQVLADNSTWILTEEDKLFDAYGKQNYKIILHIRLNSMKRGTDWPDAKGTVHLDKIFPTEYHPLWLNKETGKFEAVFNPQFWRRSILQWILIFVEYGADKATALMYIKFHVDERIAGRGSEEQKQYVGKEVPGMTSWDMVAAFHNFKTVKKNPGCVLLGSHEESQIIENGHKVDKPMEMTSMMGQVEEMEKLIKQNQSFEDAFKQMKLQ